ncbi:Hypothetical Protein SLY_0492 [Strawberry lethal yellows phytoplasma (CPA) str. NZSb11]|uniref:Uncharacterized protein n=1 Tax=Strawberry lethal yellows phytoplasma (CPA) str. NZSb11 TaxID=980422 RepID=R4RX06_PHYAS|nr:Hypothetical Protein SLY_0492 [Strawberry lethal yellows phytoplasma (CPA) str. NZSb11]
MRSSTQVAIRGVPAKDVVREIGARVRIPSAPPLILFLKLFEIFLFLKK